MNRNKQQLHNDKRKIADSLEKIVKLLENEQKIKNSVKQIQ